MSLLSRRKTGIFIGNDQLALSSASWSGGLIRESRTALCSLLQGTVIISSTSVNIRDAKQLRSGFDTMFDNGFLKKGMKIALSLPDQVARTLVLEVDDIPANESDAEEFFLWRLEKLLVMPVGNCEISFQVLESKSPLKKVLVSLVKTEIFNEYKEFIASLGLVVANVGISSLLVFNLFHDKMTAGLARDDGFYLMCNFGDYLVFMAVKGGVLEFVRSRRIVQSVGDNGGGDLLNYILSETKTSMSMHAEKADSVFDNMFLFGNQMPDGFKEMIGMPCSNLDIGMLTQNNGPGRHDLNLSVAEILSLAAGL